MSDSKPGERLKLEDIKSSFDDPEYTGGGPPGTMSTQAVGVSTKKDIDLGDVALLGLSRIFWTIVIIGVIWLIVSIFIMDDWFFGLVGKKPSVLVGSEHLSAQWKHERALSSKSNWGGPMYERCCGIY